MKHDIRLPLSRALPALLGLLLAIAAAPVPAAGAAAAPSGAVRAVSDAALTQGTIVFIRGGNVWIARPDGSGARALTGDGTAEEPYRTPTQDDQGTVYALRGHGAKAVVHRLDQQGRLLGGYRVPVPSFGPDFVSVSPDGKTLAYETMFAGSDCSYTPCHTFFQHAVEYAVAATGAAWPGGNHVDDASFATWAGNDRVVVQSTQLNRVLLHRPAETGATEWFASCLSYQEGCAETDTFNFAPAMNRQGTAFATSRLEDVDGAKAAYLIVLSTTGGLGGNPPPPPGAGCAHPAAPPTADFPGRTDLTLSAPSFSPDGSTVAFAELEAGGWVTKLYTPVLGDCAASDPAAVLADAAEPHWSAAPLAPPAATPTDPGTPGPPDEPGKPAPTALTWTKAKHPKLKVAQVKSKSKSKVKVGKVLRPAMKKKALRKGFAPKATKLRFQWLRNGKPIKRATRMKYRVRKADRHKRLKVRITGVRKGHAKATVTTRAKRVK